MWSPTFVPVSNTRIDLSDTMDTLLAILSPTLYLAILVALARASGAGRAAGRR